MFAEPGVYIEQRMWQTKQVLEILLSNSNTWNI